MKRTFATMAVVGLGLISVTAPAVAAEKILICHATGSESNPYEGLEVNFHALNGHDADTLDIIPPNPLLPGGQNWTAAGMAINLNNCVPPAVVNPPVVVVDPPVVVVDPPAVVVVDPPAGVVDPPAGVVVDPPALVVDPPVVVSHPVVPNTPSAVTPPAGAVAPAAQTPAPQVAAKAPAQAAAVSQGTNQGFNAQTAAGGTTADSAPTWVGGLGVLVAAVMAIAVRRRSSTVIPAAR